MINYLINNLFKEVFKLLFAISMTSSEAEQRFLTLKIIKTCLGNTMKEDRLKSLLILRTKSGMITQDIDFKK